MLYISPPLCAVDVLWGGAVVRCGVTAVNGLCRNPPRHGDSVQVEVSGRQGSDEESKVGPAHREVSGEDLAEALVKLSLNESNEGCQNVLLDRCQCSKVGVYLVRRFEKCFKRWVALFWYK